MSTMDIDEAKLEAFMGQAVTDMGAVISAPLFVIGVIKGSLVLLDPKATPDEKAEGAVEMTSSAVGVGVRVMLSWMFWPIAAPPVTLTPSVRFQVRSMPVKRT